MRRTWILTALLVVALASPASAHEEVNPSTIPVGKPVFLSVTAANEKKVNLTKLTLTAPPGLAFGEATRDPAGWKGARTDTAVTWTGGAVAPGAFETFGFEIEGADQPGSLTYKVALGFADGSTEDATVVVTASATAGTGSGSRAEEGGGSGRGLAAAALAVSVVALALAGVGMARAGRSSEPSSSGAGPGPAQDW